MAHKTHDIAVKIGEYETQQGKKNRWQTVGALMQSDNGPFIILEKWFNPAGIDTQGRNGIMLSCFEPRQRGESAPQQPQQNYTQNTTAQPDDSDMPF